MIKRLKLFSVNVRITWHFIYFVVGVSKNVMAVGFQEAGRWMYTGGEDGTAKIW